MARQTTIAKPKVTNRPAWFVYSTCTNGTDFVEWASGANDIPRKVRSVSIQGGAGIVQRRTLVTMLGVKTDVTQEDMDFLNSNQEFMRMKSEGWLTVVKASGWQADPDSVAADMSQRDGSSPFVPNDFGEEDAPRVGKDKGSSYTNLPRTIPHIRNQFR